MLRDAIARAERLCAIGVNPENIVIVMTEDAYQFCAATDLNFSTNYLVESMATKAKLYGYDVGIINECANETIGTELMAASKGMDYYAGMEPGDVIIVNDEAGVAHLYTLESEPPVCFADTGWTVKFEQGLPQTAYINPAAPDGTYHIGFVPDMPSLVGITPPSDYWFPQYADQLERLTRAATTASPLDVNWESLLAAVQQGASADWRRPTGHVTVPKKKKQPPKEPELSPGDTKELDDFLNSFAAKPGM